MRNSARWIGAAGTLLLGMGAGVLAQTAAPAQPLAGGEWLPWNGAVGGGGVGLAGVIFYFYRQDRKASEDAMTKMASEFRQIVEANTRAITSLTTMIESAEKD